jgi:uncharacterized protein YggE
MSKENTGITVTGHGEVMAPPDMATVDLGISVLADTVTDAADKAGATANRLITTLKEGGIEPRDLTTTQYTVTTEYDWADNQRRFLGYRVNNNVRAVIRRVDDVGRVIDAAVTAGGDATQVNNLQFGIDDDTSLLATAREEAWKDAVAKARQLATLAGRQLGGASMIVEGVTGPPGPTPLARMRMAAEMDITTPIEGGSTTVRVDLRVRFD